MTVLEQLINSKHIVLGKDGFYEFFEYEKYISGERNDFVMHFCESVFNVKYLESNSSSCLKKSNDMSKIY